MEFAFGSAAPALLEGDVPRAPLTPAAMPRTLDSPAGAALTAPCTAQRPL